MAFVAERLGLAQERAVAFGDGENDVELLEWAGYGVAVANAHERILALADYVCPRRRRGGRRAGDRAGPRPTLVGMIDVRAARAEPDRWRAALARKGAAEAFDELLEADAPGSRSCPRSTSCAPGRSSRASRRPSSSRS